MVIKKELIFLILFITAIISILISSAVIVISAVEDNKITGDHSKEFQFALANIKCRTDFTTSYLNNLIALAPSDALSNISTNLQNDLTQMQTYASNNDTDGLRNYIKNNYDPDLKAARLGVVNWIKTNWGNLTIEQRTNLKIQHKELKTTYDTCHFTSLKEFGTGRINAFTSILDGYQKRADTLKAKDIDTTSLNQIINDAKSQIITPMQNALNSSTDEKSARQALLKYCLYDGCKTGTNFHLQAKWEIAKLDIALTKINNNTDVSQVQDKIIQLEIKITAAKTALTSVGTAKYTDNTKKQVWDNIRDANALVKEISKVLGEKKNE